MNTFNEDAKWEIVSMIPDRCAVDDWTWINDLAIAWATKHMTPAELKAKHAIAEFKRVHKTMRNEANRIFAEIGRTNAWPVRWPMYVGALPIAVGKEHVCLRAVTVGDLETFAKVQRRSAEADYAQRIAVVEGAEWSVRKLKREKRETLDLPPVTRGDGA